MLETRGFSQVAEGFSSYEGDFWLPLVFAQGSPNFHSSCEGELEVALESLQGKRDFIQTCVQDLMFLSREEWDLGVAFQTHLRSQAWYIGEAKNSALLSSPNGYLLSPQSGLRESGLLWSLKRGLEIALQAMQEKKAFISR